MSSRKLVSPALVVVALACTVCNERRPSSDNRTEDPFEGVELPTVPLRQPADMQLPAIWLTQTSVVFGSRVLSTIEDWRGGATEGRAEAERALARSAGKQGRYALGVDRRLAYGLARSAMSAGLAAGLSAVELRVGDRAHAKAIRICVAASDRPSAAADCWGRTVRPPSSSTVDAGQSRAVDAGTSDGGGGAVGDITSSPVVFDWTAPTDLMVSVESTYLRIAVQGKALRSLPRRPTDREAEAKTLVRLRESFASLRQHNGWDHRASVRVGDEVLWGGLLDVLGVLVDVGYDQILLTDVADDGP